MVTIFYIPDLQWEADDSYNRLLLTETISPILLYYFDDDNAGPIDYAVTYLMLRYSDDRHPLSHDSNVINIRAKDTYIQMVVREMDEGFGYPHRIDGFPVVITTWK